MAIRLSSTCTNCTSMSADTTCKVHHVSVNANYTCDHFALKAELDNDRQCLTCVRHETEACAHPEAAAEGMLCKSWAPTVA
ncbi:MAG: hypothetical protein AAFR59_09210 [Bacteroidota bacterium]